VFLAGSLMSSSFISGASDTKSSDHRRLLESGRASGAHVLTAACAVHAGARSPFARGRCDRASCDSSRGLPSPVTSSAADSRSGAALPPTRAVVPAPPNHRAVGAVVPSTGLSPHHLACAQPALPRLPMISAPRCTGCPSFVRFLFVTNSYSHLSGWHGKANCALR
jgi:hypothetical protein